MDIVRRVRLWLATMGKLLDGARAITALAKIMPSLSEIATMPLRGETIEYECDEGRCVGFYMYRRAGHDGWAAQHSWLSGGAKLKRHAQDEIEIILVISGCLTMLLGDDEEPVILNPTESIVFPPGQAHTTIATEESEVVGITIPSSPGYPTRGCK